MNKAVAEKHMLSIFPLSKEKLEEIISRYDYFEADKKTLLLKEQKVNTHIYFLEEGFARSFATDSIGEEVTTNIFSAPCFMQDTLSFFTQQPSSENIETITACKLWKLDYESMHENFHKDPAFREFGRNMLVHHYSLLHLRMLRMTTFSAEERYTDLIEKHADVVQNVPLKIIASYLGITDTSLSRIRKEISK